VLAGCFAVSRAAAAIGGLRFSNATISGNAADGLWQLLDLRLLRNHLVESVWHLNSQPPLFNLYAGVVLKLPTGMQLPVEVVSYLAMGWVIVLATYPLLVELRVPVIAALVVTIVGIVASPAFLLYENWFSYAYPSAACNVIAAYCLVRYLRTERWGYGVGCFTAASVLVLVNSTYQIEWLIVPLVVVCVVLRHRWRRAVVVAAVPLLVVVSWYAKDLAMFGTTTTSSWLGMNLARMVLFRAPPAQIRQLQRQGTLNGLASVTPFSPPDLYVPRYARLGHTGVPALDEVIEPNGAINFNNPIYITVSSEYLRQDIGFIRAHPGEYQTDVGIAVRDWLSPPEQYFAGPNNRNWENLLGYSVEYDRWVEWQPTVDPSIASVSLFAHTAPKPSYLSYQAIAVLILALLGTPIVAWRRRRTDRAMAATLGILWWTIGYAFVVTSLLEVGENERFRFELGPLPLVAATVVVTTVIRALKPSPHFDTQRNARSTSGR
jgi:predicted membrane channel-forming protein YqfA (hemolysin III family)